jgi:hypothetical protein
MRPKEIAATITLRSGACLTMREAEFLDLIMDLIAHTAASLRKELSGPKYCGTWKKGTRYQEQSMVTHHGSMWFCRQTTNAEPGKGSLAWQLCVKRGRDGKDAR